VIANLSQGGKLDMQIKVEKGRGYVPGNVRRYADEPPSRSAASCSTPRSRRSSA
jgi:DNA-directed RNA polymerase alpha subunit